MNKTEFISQIKVTGYDNEKKQYKFLIKIEDNENDIEENLKINLKWKYIKKSFILIKKKLNKNLYHKICYDLDTQMVIKDKNWMTAKEFIKGKNMKADPIRKLTDVQNLFNYILEQKKNNYNKFAVQVFLSNCFDILN